jgi:hypothetical protein
VGVRYCLITVPSRLRISPHPPFKWLGWPILAPRLGLSRGSLSRAALRSTLAHAIQTEALPSFRADSLHHLLLLSPAQFSALCLGYVVMPEHAHLLLSEPDQETLAVVIQTLKQGVSRRLIGEAEHFWQKRYHDSNIRNHRQFTERLRYAHRNPVSKGLCVRGLEMEQLSSQRHGRRGMCGNRIRTDCKQTGARRRKAQPASRRAPLKPFIGSDRKMTESLASKSDRSFHCRIHHLRGPRKEL